MQCSHLSVKIILAGFLKRVTGINFSDYMQRLRVDEACSLLRQTDLKVIDVAQQVGFKDIKFFYEVFKKITGKTPR